MEDQTMNDTRRKSIDAILARIAELKGALDEAKTLADDIREEVSNVQGEEQDYLDAMPESLQGGEKGDKAQATIDALDEAISSLDTVSDDIGNIGFDDIESSLAAAKE
jgi:uncharacterized coiled-coil DUF342 family protein